MTGMKKIIMTMIIIGTIEEDMLVLRAGVKMFEIKSE